MKQCYIQLGLFLLLTLWFGSCSDMNSLHDPYLQGGETTYLTKFDSISLHPGRGRVMVEYWAHDPKGKKCLVEWDLGKSSKVVDISLTDEDTPQTFILEDLNETTISFDFTVCSEDLKYRSLKYSSTVTVYGDRYESTLMNATVTSPFYDVGTQEFTFKWSSNYQNVVGYMVRYQTNTGELRERREEVTDTRKVVLSDFPQNGSFEYATVYKPSEGAIDEFMTPYEEYDPAAEFTKYAE